MSPVLSHLRGVRFMAGHRTRRSSSGWTLQHRPLTSSRRGRDAYSVISQEPLHILAFLFPLILAYEIGSRLYLGDPGAGTVQTLRAHSEMLGFFRDFGTIGRYVPAIVLCAILVVRHASTRAAWKLRPTALTAMVGESLLLTAPLIVFLMLVQMMLRGSPTPAAAMADATEDLAKLPWRSAVTISIGAGIYEELLFRLIGVSAIRLILVELVKLGRKPGTAVSLLVCAAAFAAYHDVTAPHGGVDLVRAGSLLLAGVYFGLVFVTRGYGIAVGVHIIYDVCVLVWSRPPGHGS